MSYLIKNGWMLNEQGEKVVQDIRVTGEFITETGLLTAKDGETVIDAEGLFVSPGLVDLHVHFREPGGEEKETIETGSKAAARAALPQSQPCRIQDRCRIRKSRWNGCKTGSKKPHLSGSFLTHPLRSDKPAKK